MQFAVVWRRIIFNARLVPTAGVEWRRRECRVNRRAECRRLLYVALAEAFQDPSEAAAATQDDGGGCNQKPFKFRNVPQLLR